MVVGLTGSFGAGKGIIAEYLVSQKGFKHFSVRALLLEEIAKRGLPPDRNSMIVVANDLRATHGPSYLLDTLFHRAQESGGDAVIESLRAVAEVKRIQELGGIVLGIDADPKVRYERARKRGSETDSVSFEEWLDQERRESNPDDPTKQDIFGALKASDFIIQNNHSLDELHVQVDKALAQFKQ